MYGLKASAGAIVVSESTVLSATAQARVRFIWVLLPRHVGIRYADDREEAWQPAETCRY